MTGRTFWNSVLAVLGRRERAAVRLSGQSVAAASVFAVVVAAGGGLAAMSSSAQADSVYIGTGGIGFSFGTGGYRGGYFFGGPGFYGPPYRPYGPPYYYHPYDGRAYPYRSRVYVNPPLRLAPRYAPVYGGAPQRVPPTKTGLAPFTPEYTAYCARKYKSFDPRTGTYLAYSGKFRFCR